jgi:hypothetical protein
MEKDEIIIRTSWKSIPSLILKGFACLTLFWLLIVMIYFIFKITFGYREIIEGMANSFFFAVLALFSYIAMAIVLTVIGKIAMNETKITKGGIEAKQGLLFPKHTIIKNDEIKNVKLFYYPLQFIDDIFDIKGLIVEGKKTIIINAIENAEEFMNVINSRIKKGVTTDELLEEISNLKRKIDMYEERIENLEKEIENLKKKKETEKKKFEIPLKEEL